MNTLFQNLFIFEMANNHQGSVAHGKAIIQAMATIAKQQNIKAAVKFQYRDLDTFIHPDSRDLPDIAHIPRFLSTRLEDSDFQELVAYTRENGLIAVVTPFDERSVQKCIDHGAQILKVASCSATDWPLLEKIANAGLPVIASTGGLTLDQIDKLASFLGHKELDFAIMHCVSEYPTPDEKQHMNFLARLSRRYPGVPIGYSGHEAPNNLNVVTAAIAKGAKLLERHVGVPTADITLNKYSMNPDEASAWVEQALSAHAICGDGHEKVPDEAERQSILSLARGVYAKRPIMSGDVIQEEDIYYAMPCANGQTTSGEFGQYRAKFKASRNYAANEAVSETSPTDSLLHMRALLHEARGMLNEAGVIVGNDISFEVSHHYGMDKFRETGAIFISVVNRKYCKKLAIMLPGQNHPSHRHHQKEETFQLLWGDLELITNDNKHDMLAGDVHLIEPGTWHSFSTQGGCIFEEVSTTDQRGDSEYQNHAINELDPIQRKTLLEEW